MVVALYAVLTTSLLWATSTLAQYTGRVGRDHARAPAGPAERRARHEGAPVPHDQDGRGARAALSGEGQTFHFRYTNLRLLIQGKDHMFLVPSPWHRGDPTLVVPMDGDVRVEFLR